MLRAVIFDMDGTLLDSEVVHYTVINEILKREFGYDQSMEAYRKYCGVPDRKMWPMILEEQGSASGVSPAQKREMAEGESGCPEARLQSEADDLSGAGRQAGQDGASAAGPETKEEKILKIREQAEEALFAELERMHWSEYDAYIEKNGVKSFPGVKELMTSLREEGFRLAVATGSLKRVVHSNLELLGIEDLIEAIATSEDCRNGKPDPDVFLLAAKRLGVEPADCLVVEDAGNGLLAAERAGMACAGFAGSALSSDLTLAPVVFSDYREVKPENLCEWYRMQKGGSG